VCNGPAGSADKLFDPAQMHVCAEVYLEGAGWTLIEPQAGTLGDFKGYIALDPSPPSAGMLEDAKILHPRLGAQVNETVEYYFEKHDKDKNGVLEGTS